MDTSLGQIVIEMDSEHAPITVENFLKYVDDKFYDGTVFHRVIKGFMIQGGGFGTDKKEKSTRGPIKNESNGAPSNARGTIAMARQPDPNSATAQFFINHADNTFLDYPNKGGYCTFGKVVDGKDVVDKIASTPISKQGGAFTDAPTEMVTINSIQRK